MDQRRPRFSGCEANRSVFNMICLTTRWKAALKRHHPCMRLWFFSFWNQVWQRSAMPEEVPADEYLNQWQVPPAISSTWAPVEFRHVMNAVHKQHHKSAGVDGYSGSEVAAWPVVMWSAVMMVYHTFERLQAMPSNWQCICQTHLPKASLPLGSIPVSKLRPISVMSVFWRIYTSAKLQGRDALDWYRTQLSEHQWGSRKKRDALRQILRVM